MTHILLTIFGVYCLIAGLRMVFDPGFAGRMLDDFRNNDGLCYVLGAIMTLAGTAGLIVHNVWNGWQESLASIFLWGVAIEGALFMLMPGAFIAFAQKLIPSSYGALRIIGLLVIIGGAFLVWGR